MDRHGPSWLLAACCFAGGSLGCRDTAIGPLSPPPEGLAVSLRDSARVGEMTWVDIERPMGDTGTITIESSDPAVLTIDPDRRVFPKQRGTATITARSAALVGIRIVSVEPTPDSFKVTFRFKWTPTAAETALFDRAAMRWQRVLRQTTPTTTSVPAGACLVGTAGETLVQQGVLVLVDRFDDGTVAPGVTGTAGPCVVDPEGRTRVGVFSLRQSFSEAAGSLTPSQRVVWENQFVHQLGQTLGLAGQSAANTTRPELDLSVPSDPQWTGPLAVAAYHQAGGFGPSVPVSADLNFWRPDLGTGGDIMLPTITTERRISAVSLGALADRGYRVAAGRAEPPPPVGAPSFVLQTQAWTGPSWVARNAGTTIRLR